MTAAAGLHLPPESTGESNERLRCLQDRRIVVVGGGQQTYGLADPPIGIGRAISILAARKGAEVAVADVDREAAQATVDRISREGNTGQAFVADGTNEDSIVTLIGEVAEHMGPMDGLVMSLGIASGDRLSGTPTSEWDRVMAVNVRSHFLGCKHALEVMPAGSSIVLISSTAARMPSTSNAPAYITSKAALEGLCGAVGREAANQGIRVNIVMPGLIDTSLGRLATMVKPDRADTPIPLGREGTAWEVAQSTIFLLSDQAAYITGHTLVVDGGLSNLR